MENRSTIKRARNAPKVLRDLAQVRAGGARAQLAFRRAARSDGIIVVGPWLSEIGFEVLYWIPMLNCFAEQYHVPPERIVAVSRGGAQGWYSDLADGYIELFEHFSPEELKAASEHRLERTRSQKQFARWEFDERILEIARNQLDTSVSAVLHPSLMYRAFARFWARQRPINDVRRYTLNRRLPSPAGGGEPPDLPDDYVAVKAYFSECFPETDANRAFLADLVARLAQSRPVVLLSTGIDLDDHSDFAAATTNRVVTLEHLMTPQNNLQVQTRVAAGARALVSTYGGFSYLGPFLGTPSLAFFSRESVLSEEHLYVARRAMKDLRRQGSQAGLVLLDVADLPLVELSASGAPEAAPA